MTPRMKRTVKAVLAVSERAELINELQVLTGWDREWIYYVSAGQHNETIRSVIKRVKREG